MDATQQHKYEVWASNALYLSFAVSLVSDFLLKHGYFAAHKSTGQYLTLYVVTPFLLYVYYQIRKGLRGAKTLFLTLYALVLFQLFQGLSPSSYDTSLKLSSLVVQHALQLAACVLLLLSLRTPTETSVTTAADAGAAQGQIK